MKPNCVGTGRVSSVVVAESTSEGESPQSRELAQSDELPRSDELPQSDELPPSGEFPCGAGTAEKLPECLGESGVKTGPCGGVGRAVKTGPCVDARSGVET